MNTDTDTAASQATNSAVKPATNPRPGTPVKTVKLPPGFKLAEGATIEAPEGYVVTSAGAIKRDDFTLPEHKAQRRVAVSKLQTRKPYRDKKKQWAVALDRPAPSLASRRGVTRSR